MQRRREILIKKNGTSWTVADEFMTLAIGFFMWGWHIVGHLLFASINYGFFVIGGPYFLLSYMIIKIWWAIQFDGVLHVTKKN